MWLFIPIADLCTCHKLSRRGYPVAPRAVGPADASREVVVIVICSFSFVFLLWIMC